MVFQLSAMLIIFEIINPIILIVFSILILMCVKTRVAEWTFPFALIEMLARDRLQSCLVLFNKLLFIETIIIMLVWRNDQVTCLTANWTSPKMMLCWTFVISSSPRAYTLKTKAVCAAIKDTKLLTCGKNRFHTNLAFVIVSFVIWESLPILFNCVSIGAFLSISTGSACKIHANFWSVSLLKLALEKFLNQYIIFVIRIPLIKLFLWRLDTFRPRANSLNCFNLLASIWINYHFWTNFTFFSFIIFFKVLRIIELTIVLLILLRRHGTHLHC